MADSTPATPCVEHAPPTADTVGLLAMLVDAARDRGWHVHPREHTTHGTELNRVAHILTDGVHIVGITCYTDHRTGRLHEWGAAVLADDGQCVGNTENCDAIEAITRLCTWLNGKAS